jgi:hypothetical protein
MAVYTSAAIRRRASDNDTGCPASGARLLPYEVYERYEELSRQHARLDSALDAAQSVQVELPGPFSPDHDREVAAYVAGEISAADLYRRTVARYRQP